MTVAMAQLSSKFVTKNFLSTRETR